MNYAVIKTGGKQYKVAEGDVISVERVTAQPNDAITFTDVLMVANDSDVQFGQPFVSGLTVTGKVVEHFRGEKLRIAKFKAKARYRRVTGHRQELSKIQIDSIGGKKTAVKAEAVQEAKEEKPVTKRTTRKSAAK